MGCMSDFGYVILETNLLMFMTIQACRVNNEKNEGVKKAPQAHGGGPLWSFRKYDPLVIRFHPLVKYEINVQRWPFRGGLCYLNFRTLSQK